MNLNLEDVVSHLRKVMESQGEEAYTQVLESLARSVMTSEAGVTFIQSLAQKLGDASLDLERLQAEAEAQKKMREEAQGSAAAFNAETTRKAFLAALQQQIPNLKTQAHFDVVTAAFEALQVCLNSYFGGDVLGAAQGRNALNQVLDLAAKVKSIDDTLKETPEATSNKDFIEPPKSFTEDDTVSAFLGQIAEIESSEKLQQWYSANRKALDGVMDQTLRNRLFDAIRLKRNTLAN